MKRLPHLILLASLLLSPCAAEDSEKSEVYSPPVYNITLPAELQLMPGQPVLSPSEITPVTLDEAVELSLNAHEDLTQAQAAVAQAVARVAQSRAAAQPQISARVSHTKPLYFNTAIPAGLSTGPDLGALAFFTNAAEGPSESLTISQLLYQLKGGAQ